MKVGTALLIGLPGAFLLTLLSPAHAQGAKRQVGAHVHGAGKLTLAIEDRAVSLEFDAPAQDIVGFEARPRTNEQQAAVERATATLRDPLKLFSLTPAASCTVESAASELVFEEGGAPQGGTGAAHAEFQGRYSLVCRNVEALQGIDFPYFKLFPRAEEVEVQVIAPAGQRSFEVKRSRPRLSLRNLAS